MTQDKRLEALQMRFDRAKEKRHIANLKFIAARNALDDADKQLKSALAELEAHRASVSP